MQIASRYVVGLVAFVAVQIVATGLSLADDSRLTKAIDLLAANSYSTTIAAIDEIAESGVSHAPAILTALSNRRVYLDIASKTAAYRTDSNYFDFLNAKKLDGLPTGSKSVRVNNRVRGAIKAALGTLELRAKAPEKRLRAAGEVFRRKDVSVLPTLEKIIATETDSTVKQAFIDTRAALILAKADSAKQDKINAIAILKARSKQDAVVALKVATRDADPEVSEAAKAAITFVESWLAFAAHFQNIWYGLSLGSVLLLAAIGLAITFGVMGVINMAHGEMVMLGAYTTFFVQEAFRAYAPGAFDLSLLVAVPLAFAVAGLVGIAIERGIIRFLYGRPLETLLATWGVSLILQQAVRTIFGPTNREVGAPSYMSGGFEVLGLAITYNRLWIIVFTLVMFAGLLLILRYTPLGLQMRAVTQNRRMAASMGIRTGYVDAMTFGLGSGIAGIAGVALSQIDNVSPNLGQSYIVDSFMVVVFGGVGNLWGTLVSAMTLGIVNKFLEPWAGAVLAKILILVLLILFIQK
ncbi:MAG TPA: urea ABC transporter permease subunit UrtB, partial [Hyphomicrobiaceae bacterium]|nr:urea ABC transporter permease subunit UrtB [Hyphomicrobiaceae bacterium]